MRGKITFDETRLEFKKVTSSIGSILGKVLAFLLVSFSLAVVYYLIFSLLVSTDTERNLKEENRMYEQMYASMVEREQLIGNVLEGVRAKDDGIYRLLFNSAAPDWDEPGIDEIIIQNDTMQDKDIISHVIRKIGKLEAASARTEENFRKVMEVLSSGDAALPPMTSPIDSFSFALTGASIGERINPFIKVAVPHNGLDMIASKGEPVLASAGGTVTGVVRSSKGLGNVVTIAHEGGYVTRYAHLSDIKVTMGQKVSKGVLIGHVGESGNSFAPHLHYEVWKDSVAVDPVNFFFASAAPSDYAEMFYMSTNARQSMD